MRYEQQISAHIITIEIDGPKRIYTVPSYIYIYIFVFMHINKVETKRTVPLISSINAYIITINCFNIIFTSKEKSDNSSS